MLQDRWTRMNWMRLNWVWMISRPTENKIAQSWWIWAGIALVRRNWNLFLLGYREFRALIIQSYSDYGINMANIHIQSSKQIYIHDPRTSHYLYVGSFSIAFCIYIHTIYIVLLFVMNSSFSSPIGHTVMFVVHYDILHDIHFQTTNEYKKKIENVIYHPGVSDCAMCMEQI